jgi:2-haloacid dehalogenase
MKLSAHSRWATFDCYGTLIDWESGIAETLSRLWPGTDVARLVASYHELEPTLQRHSALPYREVLGRILELLARREGLPLAAGDEGALAESLPRWQPFPEVPGALRELRGNHWRLAVLSNTDPDLLQASLERIGVPVEMAITVADAGSYKPAHGHWLRFRERAGSAVDLHVHVAASLFHDIAPAVELGLTAVWINRKGEASDLTRAAELPDLSGLPAALERIAER